MTGPQYSAEQLRSLRESPLVSKPTTLPAISQWIEPPDEQKGRQRKADENENPTKRPSLFETRSRVSQTGNRDEIFLGPKLSFASATAARQATKTGAGRDKSPNEDARRKNDRNTGRDRARDRFEQTNGHNDEGRTRPKQRKDSEGERERPNLRLRNGHGEGEDRDGELSTPRRSAFGRGKFDQPWFRNEKEKEKTTEEPNEDRRTSWRDKERRPAREGEDEIFGGRQARTPSWMNEPMTAEPQMHTQQDFQAFLKGMKAKDGPPNDEPTPAPAEPVPPEPTRPGTSQAPADPIDDMPLFGLLGNSKADARKGAEEAANKKPEKPKVSRFFGASSTSQAPLSAVQPSTKVESEPVIPQASLPVFVNEPKSANPLNEDKAGFDRIMQQLRLGGGASEGSSSTNVAPPPASAPLSAMQHSKHSPPNAHPQILDRQAPARKHLRRDDPPPTNDREPQSPQARLPSTGFPATKPEMPDAKKQFFLDLMSSQRPQGSPSIENEIYGRSYAQRREVPDTMQFMNNMTAPPPKAQGPPPGFTDNQKSFAANQNIDVRPMPDPRYRGPPPAKREDLQNHHMQHFDPHSLTSPTEHRYPYQQPPAQYETQPQQRRPRRPPSQDSIIPPPGIRTTRGPGPPNVFLPGPHLQHGVPPAQPQQYHPQYPQHQLQQQFSQHHMPHHPQQLPQQQMRGPPTANNYGPPPGFQPAPPGMQAMQPPGLGSRGVPVQQMRPPLDMNTDRMMAPPGYSPYVKQGGAGAFGGM